MPNMGSIKSKEQAEIFAPQNCKKQGKPLNKELLHP